MKKTHSLGLVLSGGGTRSGYQVGALRALAEAHQIRDVDIVVTSSGGSGPGMFYLAQRFDEMYEWAERFDDPQFISWLRMYHGPIMDIMFLVYGIFARQVPSLAREASASSARWFIAATRFPKREPHWFTRESEGELLEHLHAAKTVLGLCGLPVCVGGEEYADGCFSLTIEDCIDKAFAEGAERVILIDNGLYGKAAAHVRSLLRYCVRKAPQHVREAMEDFCANGVRPPNERPGLYVCRRANIATRHGLVRGSRYHRETIRQGYTDMALLDLGGCR